MLKVELSIRTIVFFPVLIPRSIAPVHPAHRGGPVPVYVACEVGLEVGTVGRGRTVTVGRTSVVWLCGLDRWLESATRQVWAL